MPRTFIAVPLPNDVRSQLGVCARRMAAAWPDGTVRWVAADNLHLTLRFLGETAVEDLPRLQAGLDAIGTRHDRFTLTVAGIGCFPNTRRPRVIWAGLEGQQQALGRLQQAVEGMVQGFDWPAESRPFHPHLTLGRVRDGGSGNRPLTESWAADPPSRSFAVDSLKLIQSVLGPAGARYTTLHVSRLGRC